MGGQERQAHAHVEEPFLLRNYYRILARYGCDLRAGRVGGLGNAALRQRPTSASNGNRAWRGAGKVSQYKGGLGVQRKLVRHGIPHARGRSALIEIAVSSEVEGLCVSLESQPRQPRREGPCRRQK